MLTLKLLVDLFYFWELFFPPVLCLMLKTPDSEIDSAPHRRPRRPPLPFWCCSRTTVFLPFGSGVKKILVVGPLAESMEDNAWKLCRDFINAVSVLEGIRKQFRRSHRYVPGNNLL